MWNLKRINVPQGKEGDGKEPENPQPIAIIRKRKCLAKFQIVVPLSPADAHALQTICILGSFQLY